MKVRFTKLQILTGKLILAITSSINLGVSIYLNLWGFAMTFLGLWGLFTLLLIFDIEENSKQ